MNTLPLVLQPLAERLGWALLHSLWQGLVVTALLAIVLRTLRHASPAARHVACIAALAALLAGVAVTACKVDPTPARSAQATGKTPALAGHETTTALDPEIIGTAPLAPGQNATSMPDAAPARFASATEANKSAPLHAALAWRAQIAPLLPWIAAGWIAGILLLSLRHAGGWLQVRALRRRDVSSAPAAVAKIFAALAERLALRRVAQVLASARATTPMLVGIFKPVILLPAGVLTGLGARELEAILAHELAHLARGDAWTNLFQIVVETVLFYHPAAWWIGRRARLEREHAADDLAVKLCADRLTYAGALARLAELAAVPPLALAATGGSLLARIRRIVLPVNQPEPAGGWAVGTLALAFAAVAALCFPLARMVAAEPPIHVAPGQSIQAAIDAAPSGAVIHLAAGEWKERITITKPLTLEGEGWEKSRIEIEEPSGDEIKRVYSDVELQEKAAKTPAEKRAAETERVRKLVRPAVWVRDTEGVVLRRLRLQGRSLRGREGGASPSALAYFQHARVTMNDCAVVGPFSGGVKITSASEVEIRGTLVAAIWSEGIVVNGAGGDRDDAPSRLHLVDSEIRNIYLYGVLLGPGCDTSVIERCRISGTAWHGIVYGNASPTITGNAIFAHARFGIAASGKTHATVRGNLFWKNEMAGVASSTGSSDILEGNTFVGNLRSGLEVSGGGKPAVTRNIFASNPVAVACGIIEDRNGAVLPVGAPVLTGNLFHENPVVLDIQDEKKPAPEGSLAADPKFRNAAKQDFAPAAGSSAKQAGIGALEPLSPAGPWPLLAEEKAIIPGDDTREFSFWTAPGEAKASKFGQAKGIIVDALQLDDDARRAAAIERIRTLLGAGDESAVRMGLGAFLLVGKAEFDKPSFRPALRKLLTSGQGDVRAQALRALAMIGPDSEDLDRAMAMQDDPSGDVRTSLPYAINQLSPEGFTGKAGEAIIRLLDRQDGKATQAVWFAMSGTKISAELEKRVVAASRQDDQGSGHSVVFYCALTFHLSKREPTVTRLIELLDSPGPVRVAHRALWGLRRGVEKDQYPRVADAALKVIAARSDESIQRQALGCLRDCGTTAHADRVKELLAKPGVTDDFKKQLEEVLAEIEKRPATL